MRPLVAAQDRRVVQHGVVEFHPHLYKRLPRCLDSELGHARAGSLCQPKAIDQPLSHLPSREAHHIFEGLHDLFLVQCSRAQFNGSPGVGHRLQPLRLYQCTVQVKDHSPDHRITSPRVSAPIMMNKTPNPRSKTCCGIRLATRDPSCAPMITPGTVKMTMLKTVVKTSGPA